MALFEKETSKIHIDNHDYVTVTKMNHIVEVQYMEKCNRYATIKRLSDCDSYVVLSTGEVKRYERFENRSQNLDGLRKTFKKLRYLINNNFIGSKNELFITLTYAENMLDTNRLYSDFNKFMKRLRYHFKDVSTIDYIDVIEPQARGAWHHHVLLKFNDLSNVFIPNNLMSDIWSFGFVRVNRIDNIDNIGAYLTAYLADIPLDEVSENMIIEHLEVVEKEILGVPKKIIKGGRMSLYPSGINLFRKSKGILYPDRKTMKYKNIKKYIGSAEKTSEKNIFLNDVEKNYENHIKFEQYNLKRKG